MFKRRPGLNHRVNSPKSVSNHPPHPKKKANPTNPPPPRCDHHKIMEDGQLLPTSMGLSGGKLCGLHPPAEQPALELRERQLPVTLLMMPEVKVEGGL